MPKIGKVEFERPTRLQPNDAVHLVDVDRIPVGSQAHHFIFVTIMGKAKVVRNRFVKNSERMRKVYVTLDRYVAITTPSPGRTREVAEPVDRHDRGITKWRHIVGREKVAQMMFDI